MEKPFLWTGALTLVVGLAVFMTLVWPWIGNTATLVGFPGRQLIVASAVIVSGLSLAGGFALIGVGIGHWRRPRRSPNDGSLEI